MFFTDKSGAQWAIDEGLRERAGLLIDNFQEWIGHVNLDQIIFIRLSGSKGKFHGKCYAISKPPITLIPKYVIMKLREFNLLKLDGLSDIDLDIFDIRYVIVINDDSISQADGDLQRVEDGTLIHEMMHIHEDGEKIVKHDLEDFSPLVDKFGPYWSTGSFKEPTEAEAQATGEFLEGMNDAVDSFVGPGSTFEEVAPFRNATKLPPPPPFVPKSGTGGSFNIDESN